MSDGTPTPIADSLISEYNSALRNRKVSRVFFALLILATVGAYVFMFWQVIADFRDKGLAQVQVELGEELSAYVPTLQRQLQRLCLFAHFFPFGRVARCVQHTAHIQRPLPMSMPPSGGFFSSHLLHSLNGCALRGASRRLSCLVTKLMRPPVKD